MTRLKVSIGTHRTQLKTAWVNDCNHPFEIDSDSFVGRVLVRVKNFTGVTPDDTPPVQATDYFAGRSRAFSIYIEGRFKERPGVAPYHGDEVLFGSDFDHLVEFPRTIFNAGMKVAKFVDNCVFYDEKAKRPFIMSPYIACMNTVAAWAAPGRSSDAVVCRRAVDFGDDPAAGDDSDHELDFVPEEVLEHGKRDSRHSLPHWRFVGLRGDPRVDEWLESHAPNLTVAHQILQDPEPHIHQAIAVPRKEHSSDSRGSPVAEAMPTKKTSADSTKGASDSPKVSGHSHFNFGHMRKTLEPEAPKHHDHFTTADHLSRPASPIHGALDAHLGPWRFRNPLLDIIEDNTFVFLDKSVPTPKRRKFFQNKQNRLDFHYDPNVVYGMAFFSPFGDLNKFDVNMNSFVHLNIRRFLGDMPIRYTLRSTRTMMAPNGQEEEEVFVTIEFALVE